jgi:hypothetical protein
MLTFDAGSPVDIPRLLPHILAGHPRILSKSEPRLGDHLSKSVKRNKVSLVYAK